MSDFVAPEAGAPLGFVAGFASRHVGAGLALQRAFGAPEGFAARDPREVPEPVEEVGPRSFAPEAPRPRHFAPADPEHNPTAGWDPLDPTPVPVPLTDPVIAARDAGYAEGLAAAALAVDEAGERDRALLAGLLDRLASGGTLDRDALARRLRETVLMLVTKVVGEVGVSPALLAGRVEAAAGHLTDSAEPALLRVHPDDVALLDGRLPSTVFAAGDPHVARGSFVLESASTVVEDGPALWLAQLEEAVDRVAVPGC